MIRINLLSQGKAKKRRTGQGERDVYIGFAAILLLGALVFLLVDRPLSDEVTKVKKQNGQLRQENEKLKSQTKDLARMEAAVQTLEEREKAIERLREARATPAWLLFELSNILTRGETGARDPSMTAGMAKRLQSDPNRQWQESWDPKQVWITKLVEKEGRFTLEGGAQTTADSTQLALRLQASMFFDDVQPEGDKEAKDQQGIHYYTFTISGKVRY